MGLMVLGVFVYLLTVVFIPMGQILGRALQQHPAIVRAYSWNVAGSLAGVWLFNGVSALVLPPGAWFVAVAVLLVVMAVLRTERREWFAVALVGAAAWLICRAGDPARPTIWSPYHKLTLSPFFADKETQQLQQGYVLEVNGTFYQHLLNLSDEFLGRRPDLFDPRAVAHSDYNLPFAFRPRIHRLLVVGAGAGNNAAAALRHGVEQVDCVEIDPQIYALGRQLHPERPYDSPRVRMIVDDARAWFKHAEGRYDMIWFGWLDSHTLGSSYNNLRLDHYVYTRESFAEARRLLSDDGIIIVSFYAGPDWLADRLYRLVRDAMGCEPLAYSATGVPRRCGGGGNLTVIGSPKPVTLNSADDPVLREFVGSHLVRPSGIARTTTDDWPYLYLPSARVPKLHWLTSLAILGVVAVAGRRKFNLAGKWDRHFFALGAAFLLLEVQAVSRATLLFGMTWIVNAIVISAVLVMILLSNLAAARWPGLPQWVVIAGLAGTVAGLAMVPLDWFNTLTGATKIVVASAFLTAPVFFAGLIFIRSFAACPDKSRALGSNLIGALVGGLLESVSFVTGIRALVLLVGVFYAIALVMRPRAATANCWAVTTATRP